MKASVKSVTNAKEFTNKTGKTSEPYNLSTSYYRTSSWKKPNTSTNFLCSL